MTLTNPHELEELFAVAEAVADAAREVTMRHFRSPRLLTENKAAGHFDPVTIADRDAEAAMRSVLSERRPDDGVLGEEHENTTGTSGLTWVLDPIDGTRGYISGTPTWGTLVSIRDADGPILGLIDQPYTGERFIGGPGRAELLKDGQGTPLSVAPAAGLDTAILFSTFPEVGTPAEYAAFRAVSSKARLTRYGMDCYAYALLAAGQIDLVIEAGLKAYDVQAPMAVIQAAGGIVTDWKGNSPADGGRVLAAASPVLHQAALEILSTAPEN
ncbi:MAG: histidinol-phosphatase [Paracoccaceae bacterium]|nr:histidinol-phosphatase [Paracoccaceae bacterium]